MRILIVGEVNLCAAAPMKLSFGRPSGKDPRWPESYLSLPADEGRTERSHALFTIQSTQIDRGIIA